MTLKSNIKSSKSWKEHVVWISSFLANSSSRRWIRSIVVIFLLVMFVWLSYSRVYRTLRQDVPLPINVNKNDPALDLTVLQAINTQREERLQREQPNYFGFSQIFVAPRKNE